MRNTGRRGIFGIEAMTHSFWHHPIYTDKWGAYTRHIEAQAHRMAKVLTQTIERKHLTLRTRLKRLARKSICFSKSTVMHDTIIGLFINREEFGLAV
jgi:insertion element IS1 protein InsB